jgi:hypothetical protein
MKKVDVNIMQPIDEFSAKKVDELMQHPEVLKIMDQYLNLDEKYQDLIKNLMAVFIVLVPLIFLLILWSFNSSLKETLDLKKQTLSVAQEIVSKESKVGILKRNYINTTAINTQSEFQQRISSVLGASGIDTTKISLGGFDSIDVAGFIIESRVDLKYNQLSNNELFTLLSKLSLSLKIKVDEISIKKNNTNNLLQGIIRVIYYGQDNQLEEDF